jgi:hypothetical protein
MSFHDLVEKGWANTVTLGCLVIVAIVEAWQEAASSVPSSINIPRLDGWWHYVPTVLLLVAGIVWLIGHFRKAPQGLQQSQPIQLSRAMLPPGIPTLSALQGQVPQVTFDAKEYFRRAYFSPLTAEIENNIKIAAERNEQGNHEAFYARFIGVGFVAYVHDIAWVVIYKSQLLLLYALNSKGLLPVSEAKKFYNQAVIDYPQTYAKYSFDQWMAYLVDAQFVVRPPSEMLDITHKGKDFLKYLAHWGRDINVKTS